MEFRSSLSVPANQVDRFSREFKSKEKQIGTTMTEESKRPILVYIKGILPSLTPTERLIAEYILKDPERTLSSSIAELRDGTGSSVGSIVAFCRSLGLQGFAGFKIALAREMTQSAFSGFGGTANGVPHRSSVFDEVFQFQVASLTETLQINSQETLRQVAMTLDRGRHIEIFSIGISYPIAYLASCKFRLIGLPVNTEFDSHMQLVAATQLQKGDVALGISCSGSTRETVHCLEVARSRGAKTICLTNSMKSPITEHADLKLFATPSEVKYFQAPLASRITQLAIVDALFVFLARKHKERSSMRLFKAGEELLKQRLS
jgi:RpiR family carbohydrate utilization transcriptional regulator